MNDLFVGNNFVGNFTAQDVLPSKITDYVVEKRSDSLVLTNGKERIRLVPADSNAEAIVDNFDENIGEDNSSIYKVATNKNIVSIVYYAYKDVKRLIHKDEQMNIYVERLVEKELIEDDRFVDYNLNNSNDVINFLKDQFMNKRSIFVREDKKSRYSFQMFGKDFRVTVTRERPGVYSINRFLKTQNKEFNFDLIQLFGEIHFVTFLDSLTLNIPEAVSFGATVQTNDIFKAWDEYMEFKEELYKESLEDLPLIKYKRFEIVGEEIVFHLEDNQNIDLDVIKNIEFEFISEFEFILPESIKAVIDLKSSRDKSNRFRMVFLNKTLNDNYDTDILRFKLQPGVQAIWADSKGIIYPSDRSLQVEKKRRDGGTRIINSKTNVTSNLIMKLSQPDVVDTKLGRDKEPLTSEVIYKMFGKQVDVKENYRNAMKIALNTPDVALIQGPPGCGKTTLIKGIVARLNQDGKNTKILVSSEQHEALYNVVEKLSNNTLIPPFVSSRRTMEDLSSEDDEKLEKNIRIFQQEFIKLCDDLLRQNKNGGDYSSFITKIVYIINQIRESNYSANTIREHIGDLRLNLIAYGYMSDVSVEFDKLNESLIRYSSRHTNSNADDPIINILRNKINAQRLKVDVYLNDDGEFQLRELQNKLKKHGFDQYLMEPGLFNVMTSLDIEMIKKRFDSYIEYVDGLRDKFISTSRNEIEIERDDYKELTENLYKKILAVSKSHKLNFFDIVNDLKYRLNDLENASEVVKTYTSVLGSTCAQAEKSKEYTSLDEGKYNFVIIDEAARANPLDLMIPIMLGINVILVGDHRQLPHYIESDFKNRFEENRAKYTNYSKDLLTKSLFAVLYENLEKAYEEGRIKYKRTIMLDTQFRMHPQIGDFISNEFYGGTILNGEGTENKVNDYKVFSPNQHVAWLDVLPYKNNNGADQKDEKGTSYVRIAEVRRIITFIKELVSKNPGRTLDIGIISYYDGQVRLLKKAIKENFPSSICDNIEIGTVDSFQGKEFDITIVSCVRSNRYPDASKSLGFIHRSDSRINVSLSRSKRLLVVVGDSETFSKNDHFRNYIEYVRKVGYYEQ